MKRLTLRTENQWRWLHEGGPLDLLRLSFHANIWQAGFAVTLLGCGFGLTWWRRWEPIEIDGWAGEPQGREHGA